MCIQYFDWRKRVRGSEGKGRQILDCFERKQRWEREINKKEGDNFYIRTEITNSIPK